MQYNMMEMFSIMFDLGANYSTELSSTMLYRAASQLKIFSAFYVRFGLFSDKGSREKGNGIGLAWVQPKLVLEKLVLSQGKFWQMMAKAQM